MGFRAVFLPRGRADAPCGRFAHRVSLIAGADAGAYRIMPRRDAMKILKIKVKPGARTEALSQLADGSWQASVKAPPVDGKANAALIALVAAHFGLRKSQVSIRSGASGRMKLVQIEE